MSFPQLIDHPRFRPVFIAFVAFSALFFVFNLFVIGGNDVYQFANNLIPPIVAGLASFLVYRIWAQSAQDSTARWVWLCLLAGLAVWTLGDLTWAFYALVLGVDVPYPSLADALWVVGYFILFTGLYAQFRAYHTAPARQVWRNITLFALALVVLSGYFVLWPIISDFDPTRLFESLLNIFYPLLDLILLPLCFLILGTLGEGRLAVAWRMITLGLMIRVASDLIFPYLTWHEIYMPDGVVNTPSALYDFVYAMSYLVAGLGFVAYGLVTMEAPAQPVAVETGALTESAPPETARNFILVSTDGVNRVISFSDNLLTLLKRQDGNDLKGALLYELLGMDVDTVNSLETELLQHGIVDALHFVVKDSAGVGINVRLSALAVYYEGKTFKGANIVLATLTPLDVADNLSVESKGMVRSILLRTGNPEREARAALSIYFNAHLRMLDDLVRQYGGKTVAQTMRMVINETALKSGWDVRKDGGDFVIMDQEDTGVLVATMVALLEAARVYAIEMVGAQRVTTEVARINEHMNPGVMNTVDEHGLRMGA